MTATLDLPAGLVLTPRRMAGVAKPVWDIVHRASQVPVVRDCESRDEAREAAAALGGIDWERDADALRADAVAKAVFLAVQFEVWHTDRRGRR